MTNMRAGFVSLLLLSAVIVSACSSAADDPLLHAGTPHTTPSIIGRITAIALPEIVVEENPAESHGSAKANVRITDKTRVLHQGNSVAGADKLVVGQTVKVWFAGPVMESYPIQATAGVIVIESKPPLKKK